MAHRVVLVPGDGVGPEVVEAARRAVEATGAEVAWDVRQAGQVARQQQGSPLPEKTVEAIRDAGAALKGPTISGGPGPGPPSADVELRRALDLHLGVHPVRSMAGATGSSPGIDLILAGMTQEDLYAGDGVEAGSDRALALRELVLAESEVGSPGRFLPPIKFMTRLGAERVARTGLGWASEAGRARVTVVHRAEERPATDGLFLEAVRKLAGDFPGLSVDELSLEAALYELEQRPAELDVLLAPSAYTGLLTEAVAACLGGTALIPRTGVGPEATVFDTLEDAVPADAGRDSASPVAQILAGALLLRHLRENGRAERLETAVERVLAERAARAPAATAEAVVATVSASSV